MLQKIRGVEQEEAFLEHQWPPGDRIHSPPDRRRRANAVKNMSPIMIGGGVFGSAGVAVEFDRRGLELD
jgi:hypothetical protein